MRLFRDHTTGNRRPLIRIFACEQDLTFEPLDTPLLNPITTGQEPLLIIGAIAGGDSAS